MFQIDRSYINHENLESLQGHIWDLRTDHKNDPTLPQIENYGITEKEFEDYLEKKQNYLDFVDGWRKRQMLVYVVLFCLPLVFFSLFKRGTTINYMEGYLSGLLVCLVAYIGYSIVKAIRAKGLRNIPCETFIKALLSWEENNKGK